MWCDIFDFAGLTRLRFSRVVSFCDTVFDLFLPPILFKCATLRLYSFPDSKDLTVTSPSNFLITSNSSSGKFASSLLFFFILLHATRSVSISLSFALLFASAYTFPFPFGTASLSHTSSSLRLRQFAPFFLPNIKSAGDFPAVLWLIAWCVRKYFRISDLQSIPKMECYSPEIFHYSTRSTEIAIAIEIICVISNISSSIWLWFRYIWMQRMS